MAFGFGFGMPRSFAVPPFSPASLFATGAPGAWYDPSDRTTLFQDSAGTTPVTAVEQPVGLMLDKSQGLVLGPTLVTNGDLSDGTTGWTAVRSTLSASSGALVVTGSGTYPGVYQSFSTTAGKTYKVAIDVVSMGTSTTVRFAPKNGIGDGGTSLAVVDFTTTGSKSAVFTAIGGASTVFVLAEQNAVVNFSIDNISVRELPGNHAFQSTAASRPVLSARYNLLTKTEQFDDAAWVKAPSDVGTYQGTGLQAVITANFGVAPDGTSTADRVQLNCNGGTTTSDRSGFNQVLPQVIVGLSYKSSFYIKPLDSTTDSQILNSNLGILAAGLAAISNTIEDVGGGWKRVTRVFTPNSTSGTFRFQILGSTGSTIPVTFDGLIWGAQLVVTSSLNSNAYQRVNTSTDYNTVGFLPYLKFDGVDDSLSTNSINFTSTDKMSVFAGVRKLSDAASAIVAELSASLTVNNGSFGLFAPNAANEYSLRSKGTIAAGPDVDGALYAAPVTNAVSALCDISGDLATLRINGAQIAQSTADQGTGNYGNYPLYIGRRNNASLPFNGQLYSMIVVGKAVTAGELTSTETYVNQKTGAY